MEMSKMLLSTLTPKPHHLTPYLARANILALPAVLHDCVTSADFQTEGVIR